MLCLLLYFLGMATVVATSRRQSRLQVIRGGSNPFAVFSRTPQARTEWALGVDGLPDPFVHNETPRSLQLTIENVPLGGDDELCPCIDVSENSFVDVQQHLLPSGQAALRYQNISSYVL